MCDGLALYLELFMYFDMFYIEWHRLARKDLWNKVYMNMNEYELDNAPKLRQKAAVCASYLNSTYI
jgi:hypothetical protein